MTIRCAAVLSGLVALLVNAHPLNAQARNFATADVERCQALESADFSAIEDAPTQVTEAKLVDAKADRLAYCRVRGYIAPNVGIEILLPAANWNGKFLEIGCGGYCGDLWAEQSFLGCGVALRKGYACIASNMGHQGGGALWAYNNLQAEIDYGFRATHVTALAGKALTEHFYGHAPAKSYYTGCSTGGRQGLVEAQRFPWDFDGIVAGAPAINLSATLLNILWASLAVEDQDGKPMFSARDIELLHHAALAQCDQDDGVKDGVISNPAACRFDPAVLTCKAGKSDRCLSRQEIEAAKKIYAGPTTSTGRQIYFDGAMPGSELAFPSYQGGSPFSRDFFRYLAFVPDPGPAWQRRNFNFDRDYKRLGMMEALYGGTDPDLRRFKAAGGKLILYHGWADAGGGGISPLKTVDYYQTVEKTMGGRAVTREFLRFFMIPGMGHCGGGAGPNDFDYLSYLEAWVERGQAPQVIVGSHLDFDKFVAAHAKRWNDEDLEDFMRNPANKTFTRPVFLYPTYARYKGTGDSNRAENFEPSASR